MTKQGSKENSNYKNWMNSSWKPMRTLESKIKNSSQVNSILDRMDLLLSLMMNIPTAPSRSIGIILCYSNSRRLGDHLTNGTGSVG
ncbi:hypothetical protein CR513_38464, partial [Mucuna pruriens]